MLQFIVRRLLLLVPILLGLSVVLFAWIRALPGGPAAALLGEHATPDQLAEATRLYGLDRPLWEQYLSFLNRLVHLDLGTSIQTHRPVLAEIGLRFPATVELALAAMVVAIVVGIPLGYLAARRVGSWLDHTTVVGSLVGVTIPIFVLGVLLKWVFAVHWHLLPAGGRQNVRIETSHPTGFYVLDGILSGNAATTWDAVLHLILPAVTLASIPLAIVVRISRATVLDVINEDYVRTARAKGLTQRVIRGRHVLRNALPPITTIIGLYAGLLLSGAVLTETVFGIPGMGSFMASAIFTRDYASIQGFILFTAVLVVVVNLLVDVAHGLLDPRVRVR